MERGSNRQSKIAGTGGGRVDHCARGAFEVLLAFAGLL